MRPPSRISRNCRKPSARGPSRFASGTVHSLNESSRVSDARQPSLSVWDDQVRDLVVAGARGDRHAGRDVGAGVGDEDLGAVHDPVAVAELGARSRGAGIRARVRLGEAERGELLPGGEVGQPVLLLLLAAEVVDRQCPERMVRGHRDRDRRVDPSELLDGDRIGDGVGACASVLLGNRHSHQTQLRHAGNELVGEAALAVELLGERRDAVPRELAHGRADELVLLVELEIQAPRRWASSTISRTP